MLSALRTQGWNQAQIARQLGRHKSTISRELRRNCSPWDGFYRPSRAVEQANGRRSQSRRNRHFTKRDLRRVIRLLEEDWSPEQIAGRLRRDRILSISHETIYRYIWHDKYCGGSLYTHLRCAQKQRRKRHNSYDSRGWLPGKRHISDRPASIERRNAIGHWEIDTVVGGGSKDCVVSLVERKTGYARIGKLKDRSMKEMRKRTTALIRQHPDRFKTITADNGTEFHEYAKIENSTGVTFYFATPYHSWERGSNENLNGLIRQYLPKRKSMDAITQHNCNVIAKKLNTRPRKRLGFRTPEECFYGV